VGECGAFLILRDALHGVSRSTNFRKAQHRSNMLARRLSALVEFGLLERRCYSDRPARYEYVLTPRDATPPVLIVCSPGQHAFCNRRTERPAGRQESAIVEPVVVDARVAGC